jgi:hypothetical protein
MTLTIFGLIAFVGLLTWRVRRLEDRVEKLRIALGGAP